MTYTRDYVELSGRFSVGVIEEDDKYKLVRVLNRFEMYIMKGDESVGPCLEKDGFWESWITTWMLNNIKPGTVFYDVGANTGYYSLLALHCGAMVAAFEPNPEYVKMLHKTGEYNNLGSLLRIHDIALSDKQGIATLHIPATLHGSASLSPMDKKWLYHEVSVETKTLDQMYGSNAAGVHVVKIDAEGAEEKIWDGMQSFLNDNPIRPPVVLLEYTPNAYSDGFIDKLQDHGVITTIDYTGAERPVDRDWIESQTDWVMLIIRKHR